MTARDLLADLTRRGFAVRAGGGALVVAPASALTADDRQAIRARRGELLAALSAIEAWDGGTANRLMFDADTLVEALGVDGRHPAVADAAAAVVAAHATRDMAAVRSAVAAFVAVVRGPAAHAAANAAAGRAE